MECNKLDVIFNDSPNSTRETDTFTVDNVIIATAAGGGGGGGNGGGTGGGGTTNN